MFDIHIGNTTGNPLVLTGKELIEGKLQDGLKLILPKSLIIRGNFRVGYITIYLDNIETPLWSCVESIGIEGEMLDIKERLESQDGNKNVLNISGILGYSPFEGVVSLKDFRMKINPWESVGLAVQSFEEVLPNFESSINPSFDKIDVPIQLVVKNEKHFDGDAVLFGFNKHFLSINYGSSVPIVIEAIVPNLKYGEILADSGCHPLKVGLIRIKVNGNLDEFLKNDIILVYKEPTGRAATIPLHLKEIDNATRNRNQLNTLEFGFTARIDARTHFELSVPKGNEIEISFFCVKKKNNDNKVKKQL
jgi:hypothetical protein